MDAAFVSLTQFEAADLANCGDGLFQSTDYLSNVLISSEDDQRFFVYLDAPEGPTYVAFDSRPIGSRRGLLWPKPVIQIDPSSFYIRDRGHEQAGDLIIDGSKAGVVARTTAGFRDLEEIPLWVTSLPAMQGGAGFHQWRLVVVEGDRQIPLFEWASTEARS